MESIEDRSGSDGPNRYIPHLCRRMVHILAVGSSGLRRFSFRALVGFVVRSLNGGSLTAIAFIASLVRCRRCL